MRSPRLPTSPRESTLALAFGSTLSMANSACSWPTLKIATCTPSTSAHTPVSGRMSVAAHTGVHRRLAWVMEAFLGVWLRYSGHRHVGRFAAFALFCARRPDLPAFLHEHDVLVGLLAVDEGAE